VNCRRKKAYSAWKPGNNSPAGSRSVSADQAEHILLIFRHSPAYKNP
jgi:hypothetical protein